MIVPKGTIDLITYFHLRLAADGTDATGLTPTNFDLQYVRSGVAPSAKVDATAASAVDAAHADNTVIEVDATDQPGVYRVDWPDAAFAAGVDEVILTVKVATAFTESLRVRLDESAANLQAVRDRLSTMVTKTGAVVDDALNSTTTFETDLTETADDHYKDCLLKFTSGALAGQSGKKITGYDGTTKFITVNPGFTAEPTAGDDFEVVDD